MKDLTLQTLRILQESEPGGTIDPSAKRRERQKRYEASEKGREARQRARRTQDDKKRHSRATMAEQRRVDRLIEEGVIESMSASEKREWLERCRDENPTLYDVLRERGLV
jgi:DNA-binding PadR family transcriptional regulator